MENKVNKYKSKLENLIGGKRNRINKLNNKNLLGNGMYGCIISPPLKCRGDPEKPVQPDLTDLSELEKRSMIKSHIENLKEYNKLYIGQVSKLMDQDKAEREFNETRALAGLDPDYKYFIYPNKICPIESSQLYQKNGNYISAIGTCDAEFNDPDANLHLLYSNYSGKIILKHSLNPSEVLKLLIGLENILVGINILHTNNLVHMDIKSGNVLTQKKDGNVVSHIIDFGLMIHIPDLFKRLLNIYPSLSQTNYFIWPIELKYISLSGTRTIRQTISDVNSYVASTLSSFRANGNNNHLQTHILNRGVPEQMYKYSDDIPDPIFGIRRITAEASILTNDMTLADLLKNTYTYFNTPEIIAWKQSIIPLGYVAFRATKLVPGTPEFSLYSKVLKGVDIYSIGILFLQVYAKYVGQITTTLPNPIGKNYKLCNIKLIKVELPPALIPYLNRLFDELTTPLTNFCLRCTHLNFIKRIDAPTALAEFQALIPRFNILADPQFEELCKYRGFI